ncbi:hypothetical protein D3C78_1290740 [compost metagenome]
MNKCLYLLIREKGSLNPYRLGHPYRQKQHVPASKKLLGTGHIQYRSRIDLRRYAEGDPRRNVRFDDACNNINRRPLCRNYEMYASSTSHLGQPCDRILNITCCNHHQIRKLINNYNYVGKNRCGVICH